MKFILCLIIINIIFSFVNMKKYPGPSCELGCNPDKGGVWQCSFDNTSECFKECITKGKDICHVIIKN